jgi:hypothetical protein
MSNDVTKSTTHEVDGYAGFEDSVEGAEEQSNRGIQGLVKFTNEALWVTREGEELSDKLELIAANIERVVQKWTPDNSAPVETIILEPGQKFPDVKKLNEEAPKSEWVEGPDGNPRGPWQAEYRVYLLHFESMERYTFVTTTIGGGIAVRELRDKTMWMRRFRGTQVYPVVTLSDVFMNTRFGGRQRPHFVIVRWITLGPEHIGALPMPEQPTLTGSAAAPTPSTKSAPDQPAATSTPSGMRTVEPPTAKEVTGDEIRF